MSADLLRRAATALRHHVAELPVRVQSDWMQDSSEIYTEPSSPLHSMRHVGTMSRDEGAEIAYYVILMHPPVALALAEVLEQAARDDDGRVKAEQNVGLANGEILRPVMKSAFALARAILREEPS